MAKDVTIKRRVSGQWEEIFPKTTLDQVTGTSALGRKILSLTSGLSSGQEALIRVKPDGNVDLVLKENVASLIGASASGHTHTVDDLVWDHQDHGLKQLLEGYADLDEHGKVLSTQLPSWVIGGLKLQGVITGNETLNGAYRQSVFSILDEDNHELHSGKYLIVEPAGAATDIVVTLGANHIINGEEGMGPITSGNSITLEAGDWIVFREKSGSNYIFDIVNNTYQEASATYYGTAKLSSAVNRDSLSGNQVITETVLKSIIQKIHYADNEGIPDLQDGDILFQFD